MQKFVLTDKYSIWDTFNVKYRQYICYNLMLSQLQLFWRNTKTMTSYVYTVDKVEDIYNLKDRLN